MTSTAARFDTTAVSNFRMRPLISSARAFSAAASEVSFAKMPWSSPVKRSSTLCFSSIVFESRLCTATRRWDCSVFALSSASTIDLSSFSITSCGRSSSIVHGVSAGGAVGEGAVSTLGTEGGGPYSSEMAKRRVNGWRESDACWNPLTEPQHRAAMMTAFIFSESALLQQICGRVGRCGRVT